MNIKYKIEKDLLFISLSMFLVVAVWIAINVYDAYVTTTIDETLKLQIVPINGKFDIDTIANIKKRQFVEPDFTSTESAQIPAAESSNIIPTTMQTASEEANITPIEPAITKIIIP